AELSRSGIRPRPFADDRASARELSRAHLIVDALLGTGSRGAAEGGISRAIELINASGRPVVALDIPSGLSANTGAHAGAAIKATVTLTFAGLKRGLVTSPGDELAGRVRVVSIGVRGHEAPRGAHAVARKARVAILQLAGSRDAVAIGPGIGLDDETAQVARGLVHELRLPMAVDADALTALAGHLDVLRDAPAPRCLTPHPGEMA